jgi:hypothetical protein
MVVPPLVGRVDSAKSGAQRKFHECGGAIFLPCGAVQKIRDGGEWLGHRDIVSRIGSEYV